MTDTCCSAILTGKYDVTRSCDSRTTVSVSLRSFVLIVRNGVLGYSDVRGKGSPRGPKTSNKRTHFSRKQSSSY